MTNEQAAGLKRTCSVAGIGAAVAAIGFVAGVPTAIAVGNVLWWGSAFLTLIGYLHTVS